MTLFALVVALVFFVMGVAFGLVLVMATGRLIRPYLARGPGAAWPRHAPLAFGACFSLLALPALSGLHHALEGWGRSVLTILGVIA